MTFAHEGETGTHEFAKGSTQRHRKTVLHAKKWMNENWCVVHKNLHPAPCMLMVLLALQQMQWAGPCHLSTNGYKQHEIWYSSFLGFVVCFLPVNPIPSFSVVVSLCSLYWRGTIHFVRDSWVKFHGSDYFPSSANCTWFLHKILLITEVWKCSCDSSGCVPKLQPPVTPLQKKKKKS